MPVDVVYGEPLDGIDVVPVPADLSVLFADAHERVTGHPAGAHPGDGVVLGKATAILRPMAGADEALDGLRSAEAPVVLAGPGVVPHVDGLRALAAAGCLGVLNTWGAKGVFDWRSHHHLATAGLQARDFELGGLRDADLILATGIDDAEANADWRLAPVVEVDPAALAALAQGWSRDQRDVPVPPLRTELARVTQAGWSCEGSPLAPSRVTLLYSEALGAGGLVAAEPGTAGYWVARTYPTSRLGGAVVPAEADRPGFAAACAVVSRLVEPDQPVLLAVDGHDGPSADGGQDAGPDGARPRAERDDRDRGRGAGMQADPADDVAAARRPTTEASSDAAPALAAAGGAALPALTTIDPCVARVLEAGRALGVDLAVEVWRADGDRLSAADHASRLERLLATGGVVTVATDAAQLDEMLAVAGPVVAWGGLDRRGSVEAS